MINVAPSFCSAYILLGMTWAAREGEYMTVATHYAFKYSIDLYFGPAHWRE